MAQPKQIPIHPVLKSKVVSALEKIKSEMDSGNHVAAAASLNELSNQFAHCHWYEDGTLVC